VFQITGVGFSLLEENRGREATCGYVSGGQFPSLSRTESITLPLTQSILGRKARQRSRRCLFFLKGIRKKRHDFRLAVKIMAEIIPVVIVSVVIGKGMRRCEPRRYDHGRPSPESRYLDVVPAVVSIHPDVTPARTGWPHHRQRRGRAETDTY
jgi:hypothetical protein